MVYKNPIIYFKKRYCSKCGTRLSVNREEEYIYPDDEDFSFRYSASYDKDKLISFSYFCSECGNETESAAQDDIHRAQKAMNKKVISDEELEQFFKSKQNISYLQLVKKKSLILCPLFSIIFLSLLVIYIFNSIYNLFNFDILIFIPSVVLSVICANMSKTKYDIAKSKLKEINNELTIYEEELKSCKKSVFLSFVFLFICILFFSVCNTILFNDLNKSDSDKLISIIFIVLTLIFEVVIFVSRIVNVIFCIRKWREYKKTTHENDNI